MNETLKPAPTFRDLERQGWIAKAPSYDAWIGTITRGAIGPLLDAARVARGTRLLDIACGPGYGAGLAAARGAEARGVDFAPSMVAEARRAYPGAAFDEGDAAALPYADAAFDAAICGFGLLHMADPDGAIAEAHRVLAPGGRYAFTVWAGPDRHDFFALVLGAIQAHGRMDVDLPPAPPIFRFSDQDACERALAAAGFAEIAVETLPLAWQEPGSVLEMIDRGTVRMAM